MKMIGINLQNIETMYRTQYQWFKKKKKSRSQKTFLQRRYTDNQKAYEKIFTKLIIREVQVKTTMRYYLTLVRMANIKKSTNNKCWRECGEKEPSYSVDGTVNGNSHYGEQ